MLLWNNVLATKNGIRDIFEPVEPCDSPLVELHDILTSLPMTRSPANQIQRETTSI